MVEEGPYRELRRRANARPCVFEKCLLAGHAHCPAARRLLLAERETVACGDASSRSACADFLDALRGPARFALGLRRPDAPLPHGKALKLQAGGLRGLARALGEEGAGDVRALLAAARARWGEWSRLPMTEIVPAVAAFSARRRR